MPTLLLAPRYTEDSNALWRAAIADGWDVRRPAGWRAPAGITGEIAIYGEPLFAAAMADQLGLCLLEPTFDWLTCLPREHVGRRVELTTLAAARAIEREAFVKPADDKSFRAAVYPSGAAVAAHESIAPATPVLVSEPVVWIAEHRCFVVEQALVATSPYARRGELARRGDDWPHEEGEEAAVRGFVADLLGDERVALPAAVVIDVGLIEGRGWAVVEANPCFGSGLYGCEPAAALMAARRACRGPADLAPGDERWVIRRDPA
ncbi:MAG TPA: ATP-grasp domain-containing protein [Kofleriaceae bacterium]|nr:ATP-grasp domain-containing protein [Kofleriaceae bacterium]